MPSLWPTVIYLRSGGEELARRRGPGFELPCVGCATRQANIASSGRNAWSQRSVEPPEKSSSGLHAASFQCLCPLCQGSEARQQSNPQSHLLRLSAQSAGRRADILSSAFRICSTHPRIAASSRFVKTGILQGVGWRSRAERRAAGEATPAGGGAGRRIAPVASFELAAVHRDSAHMGVRGGGGCCCPVYDSGPNSAS